MQRAGSEPELIGGDAAFGDVAAGTKQTVDRVARGRAPLSLQLLHRPDKLTGSFLRP